MTRLRGPDGSPSDPDDLVGSSESAPASADPVKNRATWPEVGAARGPLDEAWLNAVLPSFTFPALTPEQKVEAEAEELWEAKLLEAIESGEIGRKRPGRKPVRAVYLEMAQKCLNKADGNFARAREDFIMEAMKLRTIKRESAESRWAEAIKTLFPDR